MYRSNIVKLLNLIVISYNIECTNYDLFTRAAMLEQI